MSLDVSLILPGGGESSTGKIYVRQDGRRVELSREEWDVLHPGREPVVLIGGDFPDEVYEANITHNLRSMAGACGLYEALWCPEDIDAKKAKDLIEPLRTGLERLIANKDHMIAEFNPPNGWGSWEGLVSFTREYLDACEAHPEADIHVSR